MAQAVEAINIRFSDRLHLGKILTEEMEDWAEKLTRDVYKTYMEKYSDWKPGFKVFFCPVKKRKKVFFCPVKKNHRYPLLILGYNPGGDEEAFNKEREDLEKGVLPEKHEYIKEKENKDYRLARNMCSWLGEKLLEKSVKTNIIFFRSKDIPELKKGLEEIEEVENYCFEKVREIIKELDPKLLLIEGLSTYDELEEVLCHDKFGKVLCDFKPRKKNEPYYETELIPWWKSEWGKIKIIAISHPSRGIRKKIKEDKIKEKICEICGIRCDS